MHTITSFVKKNTVLDIAFVAALITSIIVPPDKTYLTYFDVRTLTCLFCVLAVVCAFRNIDFFYILARKTVKTLGSLRAAVTALVYITFIGSMLIANDMALLTFLPLGYFVLSACDKKEYMAFTFIMQNIAANLGGMLTPFGNPQNLYLYNEFHISNKDFFLTMLPPFVISIVLITACCMFIKNDHLVLRGNEKHLNMPKATLYTLLFALAIAVVFRGIPYYIGLIIIPAVLFFADRKALADVDYPLLLTFVCFFIFAGNMSRIDVVNRLLSYLLGKSTLIFSVISCQAISNVPSAILLSQFTGNVKELLIGVNIGGVGTLISSLASLITFREYTHYEPKKAGYYLKMFSAINFAFLIILTTSMYIIKAIV